MMIPGSYSARQRRSFSELQDLSWQIATRLFDEATVARHVEEVTCEAVRTFTEPSTATAAEGWILKELVRRAERERIERAARGRRQSRAAALAVLPAPRWEVLHARGELDALLAQLPTAQAEAFALQYVEKASLREMVRRTGASAGVITHRVAEATKRLQELASASMQATRSG